MDPAIQTALQDILRRLEALEGTREDPGSPVERVAEGIYRPRGEFETPEQVQAAAQSTMPEATTQQVAQAPDIPQPGPGMVRRGGEWQQAGQLPPPPDIPQPGPGMELVQGRWQQAEATEPEPLPPTPRELRQERAFEKRLAREQRRRDRGQTPSIDRVPLERRPEPYRRHEIGPAPAPEQPVAHDPPGGPRHTRENGVYWAVAGTLESMAGGMGEMSQRVLEIQRQVEDIRADLDMQGHE